MRSDIIKKGSERAPHRSLLRATGSIESEADWDKPFIAIVNSYTDCIPGHAHLNEVGLLVKRLVREAGGVPFIFNTIGVDDGIAMGHSGMKYSLPSRELIADCVEVMKNRLSIAALKSRMRKREKSSIGDRERSSVTIKSPSAPSDTVIVDKKTGWLQPKRGSRSIA